MGLGSPTRSRAEQSSGEPELIRRHPELFHVAEAEAWPAIRRLGLLSTSALLDRFGVNGPRREELEAAPRPDSVRLRHSSLGEVWIRDNKPLRPEILATCLDGVSVAEWMRLLNARVFFWLDQDRARRLACTPARSGTGDTTSSCSTRAA
ncbi:MAG TPA: hypothetical protein VEF89_01295 [Solirubrobacteraceae bacterium]|nr:hypothetical protein [Solirubrobacteraceae bacterium]